MTAYLRLHPPARKQYVSPRRAAPTGAVAIHTAEIMADIVGLDSAAEAVASYMTRRTDPGSYHTLVDSDSTIDIVDLDDEAFHDGTGGNRWSTSISFAVKAEQWPTLPPWWVTRSLERAADAAVKHSMWFHTKKGFHIPARRITASQYRAGEAGFISHGEIDPGRRTDPGRDFPWNRFLTLYATKLNNQLTEEEDDMALPEYAQKALAMQRLDHIYVTWSGRPMNLEERRLLESDVNNRIDTGESVDALCDWLAAAHYAAWQEAQK